MNKYHDSDGTPDNRSSPGNPLDPEAVVHRFPVVSSTMEEAARILEAGAGHGTTIVAEHQTSGRGRFKSRAWCDFPGQALLATVILDPDRLLGGREKPELTLMPLVVGLAVVRMLRIRWGLDAGLKWPNDAIVGGRKIAGVLCEYRHRHVLAGVGINCGPDSFPQEYAATATAVALEQNRPAEPEEMLRVFLEQLELLFREAGSIRSLTDSIDASLIHRGRRVEYRLETPHGLEMVSGRLEGVDATGALILADRHGVRTIISGEFVGTVPEGA